MYKKINLIVSLLMLINTFQIQGNDINVPQESIQQDESILLNESEVQDQPQVKNEPMLEDVSEQESKGEEQSENLEDEFVSDSHNKNNNFNISLIVGSIFCAVIAYIKAIQLPQPVIEPVVQPVIEAQPVQPILEPQPAIQFNDFILPEDIQPLEPHHNENIKEQFRRNRQQLQQQKNSQLNSTTQFLLLENGPTHSQANDDALVQRAIQHEMRTNSNTIPRRLLKIPSEFVAAMRSTQHPQLHQEHDTDEFLRNYRSKALEEFESVKDLENIDQRKAFFEKYIVPPMEILDNETELFFGGTTKEESVKIYIERTYAPQRSDSQNVIYMPVIHGTFSKNSQGFGKNIDHPITQEIICQAEQIAFEQNATVKLFIVEWDGKWDENARIGAGHNLAKILEARVAQENPHANVSIQPISHSYGCDVARYMILNSSPRLKFDTAFFIASPQTTLDVSGRVNDIHIYGDHDAVATAETWLSLSNRTSTDLHNPRAHVNIRLKDNGSDLNHKSIKNAIRYLSEIPKFLQKYPGETAFIVNAYKKESKIDDNEDDFYIATEELISSSTCYIDGFIDESKCEPQAKNIQQHKKTEQKFKQTYGIQDPYTKPTFAAACESEFKSAGVTGGYKGIVRKAAVAVVGGIENFLNSTPTKLPSPKAVHKLPAASDLQEEEEN